MVNDSLGAERAPTQYPPDASEPGTQRWFKYGQSDRSIKRGAYQRTSDLWVSLTDPDAVLMRQHNHGVHLRYRDQYLVDGGKARIILGVLVTAADVKENMPFAAFIRSIWTGWRRITRPRRTKRQIKNARSGLSHCLVRASSGTARGSSDCAAWRR